MKAEVLISLYITHLLVYNIWGGGFTGIIIHRNSWLPQERVHVELLNHKAMWPANERAQASSLVI